MLKFRLLTIRDISISLILSIGSLGISIGLIGMKNLLITALFFIVPLILTLVLFLIYKPTNIQFDDGKKGY